MNRLSAIALVILAVMVAVWGFNRKRDASDSVPSSFENTKATSQTKLIAPKPAVSMEPVAPEKAKIQSTNLKRTAQEFKSCFGVSGTVDISQPDLESWKGLISSSLGEISGRAEEWRNTHIQLPNGEKRRMHLEVEDNEQGVPVLKLKYASVDKDDLPVPIELSREQSENPSPTFIASLENEGTVTLFEMAEKWLFSEGGEVSIVERNKVVNELEISKNGKSFRCIQLETSHGQCDCI